jgi:hypothetical protein
MGVRIIGVVIIFGLVAIFHHLLQTYEIEYYALADSWLLGCIAGVGFTQYMLYDLYIQHYLTSPKVSDRRKRIARRVMSLVIGGLALFIGIVLFASLSPVSENAAFIIYSMSVGTLLVLSLLFCLIDIWLLKIRDEYVVTFDLSVLFCVVATTLVPTIFSEIWYSARHMGYFPVIFKAGAIAFEVMLACLLFDPTYLLRDDDDQKVAPVGITPPNTPSAVPNQAKTP